MATGTVREASGRGPDAICALYRDLHDGDEPADPVALATAKRAPSAYLGVSISVAETHGDPVSSCVLFVLPNLSQGTRPFGLIENVVTWRDGRNRGRVTVLLDHALAPAWRAGCYKVLLFTGRSDPSVNRFLRGIKTGYAAYTPGMSP